MDNVVQNINIEDIIPSNFKPSIEEKRKIDELALLIKQFGLLEPILVRPKNGKYEIILGMDKYQASLIANQNTIPVIVKEIDDDVYSKYSNIDNNKIESLNTLTKETFSNKEQNSDVVNLSELSKIKLEYERNDVKMNNGQINNDMTNNNFVQPNIGGQNQAPTFGGRFFPSLEDEPTNMNMIGSQNLQPNLPQTPPANNNDFNNNLIDLTDLSLEKDPTPIIPTDFGTPTMNMPNLEPSPNLNFNQPQNNNFDTPNIGINTMPSNDNIINLESLQNNNPPIKPVSELVSEPVSMDILNADFGAPNSSVNQFDMGPINQNISQSQVFNEPQNPVQLDFGLNQPTMMNQQPTPMASTDFGTPIMNMPNLEPSPNFDMNPINTIQQPTVEINSTSNKDITPVTNTIKNLVTNLEAFGYKISIVEEELPNMSKLTIEIEK